MNFNLVTALLCTFSWISVSVSEFYIVEVEPGEEATLVCSNFTTFPAHIHWFRLNTGSNYSCISSMGSFGGKATFCDGFQNSKFKMTSNSTTILLKIKRVASSDYGLYFCGFYLEENTVIVHATHLKVQEVFDALPKLTSMILGGLIFSLIIVIICLVVKIRNIFEQLTDSCCFPNLGHDERQNPQPSENLASDALHYAALSFKLRAKTNRMPASERELEPNVVYAATR
ncbi:uncharacterized protein [Channa argus]|uniref:uncharacterized protein n=1 Tax=Channa argus TaxID=215402 RepID=UPI00351FABA2